MADDRDAKIYVWDPVVRACHWLLLAAFIIASVTEDELLGVHAWAGYTVGVIVAFRVLWGFVGPRHARFSEFLTRPRVALAYIRELLALRGERHVGHSPGGGAMVVLLLATLAVTVATGIVAYGIEEHAGPLAGWFDGPAGWLGKGVKEIHELAANITLALAILHVCGVLLASLVHRENLVKSMITGFKKR